eukprot:1190084-Prorocentrum_minimum.AAC.2
MSSVLLQSSTSCGADDSLALSRPSTPGTLTVGGDGQGAGGSVSEAATTPRKADDQRNIYNY